MKTYFYLNSIAILLLVCFGNLANAQEQLQRNDRRPVLIDDINGDLLLKRNSEISCYGVSIANLSTEQAQQICTLEVDKQRQLNQLNNQLEEKKARLHTLEAQDKPDMKAIYQAIDEQAKLLADKMKADADCKQKIRALLTEEQRVVFDARVR